MFYIRRKSVTPQMEVLFFLNGEFSFGISLVLHVFLRSSFSVYHKGSQPFSYHVPLQHSDKWACTPTAFQQVRMYCCSWLYQQQ